MLGGYQILDLRSIDLSRGTSESSISDASVLAQLLNIRDHIQKTYDFSKPLHAQLKPLLIRYRDKKVGEKHEVALYGNIEVINTYYKFRIIANNEGEQLTINVEFEEKTDEYDNKYWDIKTAKILLTSAEQTIEDILADGNVDNAKPIYYHPVFVRDNVSTSRLSFVILDNNPEAYTWNTFKTKIKALMKAGAYIQCNGFFMITTNCYNAFILYEESTDNFHLYGNKADGTQAWISLDNITASSFDDGVNKIN